jgi:chromate reductase
MKIVAFAGSLRKGSLNRRLLRYAIEGAAAAGGAVEELPPDALALPLYNGDLERDGRYPPDVEAWRARIAGAEGLLIASPEYNHGMSGVLKNAIDWGSRPFGDSCWAGKPAAVMGASVGAFGAARAQYHLRQILVTLDMPTLNQPEVAIGAAHKRFDESGKLTDETSRKLLAQLLQNLVAWTRRLRTEG